VKKVLSILVAALLVVTLANPVKVNAADSAKVYVTIADGEGELALIQEAVTVTDADGDGALTINDALYLAHEAKFEGGAAAGYASATTEYGLSLTKLWGVENGGSYGYYVNNVSSMGLGDPVKDGDYIYAFVYTDTTTWSDAYSYFDVNQASTTEDGELTLTLMAAGGYDESWNVIMKPVEGATITINGEESDFVTDAEGKVTITGLTEGTALISAKSDAMTLVPPAVYVDVTASTSEAPMLIAPKPENLSETGASAAAIYVFGSAMAICAAYVGKRKNEIEK